MKRQMFMIGNMTCPNCAAKLESSARKLNGVKEATVSFGTGALTVEYDEQVVGQEQISELASQLGLLVMTVLERPRV
ncbi:MAG: cation transporter [Bacillota bacterium]